MNDEQMITQVIEKAEKNGYQRDKYRFPMWRIVEHPEFIIFKHSFAKAFWGEEQIKRESDFSKLIAYCFWHVTHYLGVQSQEGRQQKFNDLHGMNFEDVPAWQYHLQQMVLEEIPILYLEKFL